MADVKPSVFATLNAIDCGEHIEKKNGLSYLSWAWAWSIAKQNFPDATYTIYEWTCGIGCPVNYFTDGRTCWVRTGVTIKGVEHIEMLPVMDFRNQSIPKDKVTSMDVNKAIQRSLTKALARHGLGLYIYAGEDLPEEAADKAENTANSAFKPCGEEMYQKFVSAAARGEKTPSGLTAEQSYAKLTHAGPAELAFFKRDVEQYRINNSI